MFGTLAAMSAIGFFSIIGLHYIPWGKLFGKELCPPWTYVVGVTVIGATFSLWALWAQPEWGWSVVGFWSITAATGMGDIVCYGLDSLGGLLMAGRTHGRPPFDGYARE